MDSPANRGPEADCRKTMLTVLLFMTGLMTLPGDTTAFKKHEIVWVYLTENILNNSDFGVRGGLYSEGVSLSCFVGVGTHLEDLRNYTLFKNIKKPMDFTDIYNWGSVVTKIETGMFSLKLAGITSPRDCVVFSGCTRDCVDLTERSLMRCDSFSLVLYAMGHLKLPTWWFLLCGKTAYSFVPANSAGGPCTIGRVTVHMSQKATLKHGVKTKRQISSLLTCGDRVHLWRAAECASMAIFVTPVMIGFLNAELEYLACTTSRTLDTTSHATGAVRQELSQVRKATGELQVMVDYLLLRQSHGCEQFKRNSHFDQLDSAQLINKKSKIINEIVSKIKESDSYFLTPKL